MKSSIRGILGVMRCGGGGIHPKGHLNFGICKIILFQGWRFKGKSNRKSRVRAGVPILGGAYMVEH